MMPRKFDAFMTWQPARGDRVYLKYDRTCRGTVVVAGPEQSEVRVDGRDKNRTLIFSNSNLIRLVERVRSRRGGK